MRIDFFDFTVVDHRMIMRHLIALHIQTMQRILERLALRHLLVKVLQALLSALLAKTDLKYTVTRLRNLAEPAEFLLLLPLNTAFWPLLKMCKCLKHLLRFLMKFPGLIPHLAFGPGFERLYFTPFKVPPVALFLQAGP